jgi:hypothetical protein
VVAGSQTLAGQAAGGDLSGNWPNVVVGAGAIGDSKVATGIGRNKLAAVESWHVLNAAGGAAPALNTNWASLSALGSQWAPVSYCLDPAAEVVHLRGAAYLTGSPSQPGPFTLPVGYRPSKYRFVSTSYFDSSANATVNAMLSIALEIRDDGSMIVTLPGAGSIVFGTNDILYLDGVRFKL